MSLNVNSWKVYQGLNFPESNSGNNRMIEFQQMTAAFLTRIKPTDAQRLNPWSLKTSVLQTRHSQFLGLVFCRRTPWRNTSCHPPAGAQGLDLLPAVDAIVTVSLESQVSLTIRMDQGQTREDSPVGGTVRSQRLESSVSCRTQRMTLKPLQLPGIRDQ